MASGDVTVMGLVSETHIIEDIGIVVPRNVAVTIPADLVLLSKDLHRACSQGFVVYLHSTPSTVPALHASGVLAKEETEAVRSDNARLLLQNETLSVSNDVLEKQISTLQAEVLRLQAHGSKLDAILEALKDRPAPPAAPTPAVPMVEEAPVGEVATPNALEHVPHPELVAHFLRAE